MKIGAKSMAILLIATILGGVLILMAIGSWNTKSSKTPVKFSTGTYVGMSNPADIRGSYSFADVERNFPISAEVIARAYAFDTSARAAGSYVAKDIEGAYGEIEDGSGEIGTDSLKWFVSLYTGLPYEPEGDTYLPRSALELLVQEGKIDVATAQALAPRVSGMPKSELGISPEVHVEPTGDQVIKGNTTYAEVISWGVTQQQIEKVLGMPLTSRTRNIREHLTENNLNFSTVKNQLQALVELVGR